MPFLKKKLNSLFTLNYSQPLIFCPFLLLVSLPFCFLVFFFLLDGPGFVLIPYSQSFLTLTRSHNFYHKDPFELKYTRESDKSKDIAMHLTAKTRYNLGLPLNRIIAAISTLTNNKWALYSTVFCWKNHWSSMCFDNHCNKFITQKIDFAILLLTEYWNLLWMFFMETIKLG